MSGSNFDDRPLYSSRITNTYIKLIKRKYGYINIKKLLRHAGIEPYQITSSIWGVLNQRLIRRLCDTCKQQRDDQEYDAVGCSECFSTGYRGRVLVAELLQMDSALRRSILQKADLEEIEALLGARAHASVLAHGESLIAEGVTSREELNQTFGIA